MQVDLEAGQEQQEREPDDGEDLDGQVGVDPSEDARAEDDAGDDLQDRTRDAQPRREPEQEWNTERDERDQEQVDESGSSYLRWVMG